MRIVPSPRWGGGGYLDYIMGHWASLGAGDFSSRCLLEILRTFERAHQVTYSQSSKIAALMKQVSTRYLYMCLEGSPWEQGSVGSL